VKEGARLHKTWKNEIKSIRARQVRPVRAEGITVLAWNEILVKWAQGCAEGEGKVSTFYVSASSNRLVDSAA
jgi:hypothetical protein